VGVSKCNYGGKDLWKRRVLSPEWNSECVMAGESGEQVEDELESVTSSAEWLYTVAESQSRYSCSYYIIRWIIRRCVCAVFHTWRRIPPHRRQICGAEVLRYWPYVYCLSVCLSVYHLSSDVDLPGSVRSSHQTVSGASEN